MVISNENVNFKFKMSGDVEWQTFNSPLEHLKKTDCTDAETLSIEIHEIIYAMDSRAYEDRDNLIYGVDGFWNDVVLFCQEKLYGVINLKSYWKLCIIDTLQKVYGE